MIRIVLAILALVALASNAEARHRRVLVADPNCNIVFPCEGVTASPRGETIARKMRFGAPQKVYSGHRSEIVAHPSGCPARLFCACGAAVRVFGAPLRSLWTAAAWFKFPRSSPAPGMVAVRSHHVFVLEQHIEGNVWLAFDANSGGHATRIHARSIAGYAIVNPHG